MSAVHSKWLLPREGRLGTRTSRLTVLAMCGAFTIAGCNKNTNESCAIIRGPDALLTVTEARSTQGGANIPMVIIRSFTKAGVLPIDLASLAADPNARSVRSGPSGLECQITCAFGSDEQTYEVRVGAPGYRDTTVTVTARYATLTEGCPHVQRGSQAVRFTLPPLATP